MDVGRITDLPLAKVTSDRLASFRPSNLVVLTTVTNHKARRPGVLVVS